MGFIQLTNLSQFVHMILVTSLFLSVDTSHAVSMNDSININGFAEVVVIDDFRTGEVAFRYFIVDELTQRRSEVFFSGPINPAFRTGNLVNLQGFARDRVGELNVAYVELKAIIDPHTQKLPSNSHVDGIAEASTETRKILTLLVDFNDAVVYDYSNPSNTPNGATVQDIRDLMYHSPKNVAGAYHETSIGKLMLPSDPNNIGEDAVYGPYKIDFDMYGKSGQCPYPGEYVEAALSLWETDTGQIRTNYQHYLLITPNWYDYDYNDSCGVNGLGVLGCFGSCWAFAGYPLFMAHSVILHELGHNFGLHHARSDPMNTGMVYCEYCDNSDFMGGGQPEWRKLNPPHFEYMNWYDPDTFELRTVIPASEPQTFDLIPVGENHLDWPGLRAIKTKKTTLANYYVSYRQQGGKYDDVSYEFTTGVSLHWADGDNYSYFIRVLEPGDVFVDNVAGLIIEAVGPNIIESADGSSTTQVFTVNLCNTNCSAYLLFRDGFEENSPQSPQLLD